jgi:hypothetical protein
MESEPTETDSAAFSADSEPVFEVRPCSEEDVEAEEE